MIEVSMGYFVGLAVIFTFCSLLFAVIDFVLLIFTK